MKRLVLGVIGHVDHGKTALVHALTGMDTDRLPEEKRRGISIALGFAYFRPGADAEIDLIDMPGHERFVRTMIAGSTGMDGVLLVVAANEGIKPQTIEHVDIAALLGVSRVVIAVSKSDLVTPEAAALTAQATAALLSASGLHASAWVVTSVVRGEGIAALREALQDIAAEPDLADGILFLPIDRSFSVAGHGTVVTGTLRGASLAPGDELELLPGGQRVRVRGLQVHGGPVPAAHPGQRVAVNLRNVERAQVPRGSALTVPGRLTPSDWLSVHLRAVAGAPPLRTASRLRLLFATAELDVRLHLLDRDVLEPGQSALAQLHCATPASVPAREHVILRLPSPARTVAGGLILEAETGRHRRQSAAILQRLAALASLSPAAVMLRELEAAGAAGRSLQHLSRLTSLMPERVAELLAAARVVIGRGQVAMMPAALRALQERIQAVLAAGEGLPRERLAASLGDPGAGEEMLDEALQRLVASGAVVLRAGTYALPRPDQDQARVSLESRLAAEIAQALRDGGLAPPDPAAVVTEVEGKRALDRLVREGEIVRTHDRSQKRDVLFHRDAIADARHRLTPLLAHRPGLLVSEVGAALGISRKYSVPLLEHLDTIRFTRRVGDRRVLALAPATE